MSYIKTLKAIIISVILIVIIEVTILLATSYEHNRRVVLRDSLLYLNYLKDDVGQEYVIGYKNYIFFGSNAEFIQIGDSSGFYSLKPTTLEQYLKGNKYINLSCCADIGWEGYYSIAERHLKNNKNRKFLVLYLTPYSIAKIYGENDLSNSLYNQYSSKWSPLYTLPSIAYRKTIVEGLYYHQKKRGEHEFLEYIMGNYKPKDGHYLGFMAKNLGWIPYERKEREFPHMPIGACGPHIYSDDGNFNPKLLLKNLNKIKKLSEKYKVKMILLFNPVACSNSSEIAPITSAINQFKKQNPDVLVPYDLITTWQSQDFSDEWHLTPEAAEVNSKRIGTWLEKINGN